MKFVHNSHTYVDIHICISDVTSELSHRPVDAYKHEERRNNQYTKPTQKFLFIDDEYGVT